MTKKDLIGQWIHVQSYKHDESLHRTWDTAMVVDVTDDYIVTVNNSTKVIESDGRRWYTREPAVSIFMFKEWYNLIAMFKKEAIMYYCNIASPSLIDKNCIKYIDYDLDLKLLGDKEIVELDGKEYEYHRKKMKYSADLDKVIKYAFKSTRELMEKGVFPFNDQKMEEYYHKYLKLVEEQDNQLING
jgi:protein associated with RNAse G/E